MLRTACYAKWFCLVIENFGAFHFLTLQFKFYELFILQLIQGEFCAVAQYFFRLGFLKVNFLGLICFLTATHSSRFHFFCPRIPVKGFYKFKFVRIFRFQFVSFSANLKSADSKILFVAVFRTCFIAFS
jgi:hypothetical protein